MERNIQTEIDELCAKVALKTTDRNMVGLRWKNPDRCLFILQRMHLIRSSQEELGIPPRFASTQFKELRDELLAEDRREEKQKEDDKQRDQRRREREEADKHGFDPSDFNCRYNQLQAVWDAEEKAGYYKHAGHELWEDVVLGFKGLQVFFPEDQVWRQIEADYADGKLPEEAYVKLKDREEGPLVMELEAGVCQLSTDEEIPF